MHFPTFEPFMFDMNIDYGLRDGYLMVSLGFEFWVQVLYRDSCMRLKSGLFNSQQRWEAALDILDGDERTWRLVELSYWALFNVHLEFEVVLTSCSRPLLRPQAGSLEPCAKYVHVHLSQSGYKRDLSARLF